MENDRIKKVTDMPRLKDQMNKTSHIQNTTGD